jgi:hypothetical protein
VVAVVTAAAATSITEVAVAVITTAAVVEVSTTAHLVEATITAHLAEVTITGPPRSVSTTAERTTRGTCRLAPRPTSLSLLLFQGSVSSFRGSKISDLLIPIYTFTIH